MADANEVVEWANNLKWEKYAGNKEVVDGLTALRQKITALDGAEGGGAGGNQRVKLVVVGDGAVGKTSLLISFAENKFPEDYVPTVFENYTSRITRDDGTLVLLHLWDTAGQEDYDRLRPLSYPGADVILLCFSTVTASSFASIKEKWYPEVNHYVPDAPYVLVGTKLDLREAGLPDPSTGESDPVTPEKAEEMRKQIKALKYIEVSAKTRKNLQTLFAEAVEIVLAERRAHEPTKPSGAGSTTSNANGTKTENTPREEPIRKKKERRCLLM
jgi:small GTP-binding protein